MRNLHLIFDRYYIGQIYGGDFAKFVAFSEYMNFIFQLFWSDFFSEKQKAAVEFTIIIEKLISCFHNSTLQEFSNISDRIYT